MKKIKTKLKVASCWSGGKDSCLAYFKAARYGYGIVSLVNLVSKDNRLVSFHEINQNLIEAQAKAVGIPLLQEKVVSQEAEPERFEQEVKNLVKKLADKGIKGLVFGYSDPEDRQRYLSKKICSELDLKLIEPLCGKDSKEILKEFIELGFKAVIVKIDSRILDKSWLGHLIDKDFFDYLREREESGDFIDFGGNLGEFHTFVIDGPIFKKKIKLLETSKIKKGSSWVLDIKGYQLL